MERLEDRRGTGSSDYGLSGAEITEPFEIPLDRIEAILTYAQSHRVAHPGLIDVPVMVTPDQNIHYRRNAAIAETTLAASHKSPRYSIP